VLSKNLLRITLSLCASCMLICLFGNYAEAYVFARTSYGDRVSWRRDINTIKLYTNPDNGHGISSSVTQGIINESLSDWQANVPFTIETYSASSTGTSGINELFFTNSPYYFNSDGVVAVTQISYNESTSEILEADIVISNQSFTGSAIKSDTTYIGNIVSHEFGHFLGLSHSEVKNSSMFYKLARGQYKISEDEISAIKTSYGKNATAGIYGKVIAGKNLTPILGTHVQLISLKNGKIISGSISDASGNFSIRGIDNNDSYFLYLGPSKKLDSLPSYFSYAKNDFCEGRTVYRGGFYSTCFSSDAGHPQKIDVSSLGMVDVGNVSIRCGLDVPRDYLQAKGGSQKIQINDDGTFGHYQVGYFTKNDASNSTPDEFEYDLSGLTLTSGTKYFEIKAVFNSLYSPIKLDVQITRKDGLVVSYPILSDGVQKDADNTINFDIIGRLPLDSSNYSNNIFTVKVTPVLMSDYATNVLIPSYNYSLEDVFPSYNEFIDRQNFYFIMANVAKLASGNYEPVLTPTSKKIYDNQNCPQGNSAYEIPAKVAAREKQSTKQSAIENSQILSCASIKMKGPPGNGPGGFLPTAMFGFLLIFILRKLKICFC